MKKLILFLSFAALLCACKEDEQQTEDDRLVGQTWVRTDNTDADLSFMQIFYGGEWADVYMFESTDKVLHYLTKNNKIWRDVDSYSYSLDYPNLIIREVLNDDTIDIDYVFLNSITFQHGTGEFAMTYYKEK